MAEPVHKNDISPLNRSRLYPGDHFRTLHVACVPEGTPREVLSEPEFWKHVSAGMRMGDRIEVYCEAGNFFAEYLVLNAGNNWVNLAELRWHELQAAPELDENAEYEVKFGNMHTRYRIIRKSDGKVIFENIATREQAENDLRDYVKALRR